MSFSNYLNESINDVGKFKAIFICGLPGVGKSYTASSLKGIIDPKIVNSDKVFEFLTHKNKKDANEQTWKNLFGDTTKKITKDLLYNYINGMLPLFIDSTSSISSNILSRKGVLESIGYDVGMIYVSADYDVIKQRLIKRNSEINRKVSLDFLEKSIENEKQHKEFFRSKFENFFEDHINLNVDSDIDNAALDKLYKKVHKFYTEDVQNTYGKMRIQMLQQDNEKYLVPSILSEEKLRSLVSNWY